MMTAGEATMTTETSTTDKLQQETDLVKLSAALRPELKRLAIAEGEEPSWGSVPELEALANRAWRTQEEMVMMIVYDWLTIAERNPEMFDRVFGSGPGSSALKGRGKE